MQARLPLAAFAVVAAMALTVPGHAAPRPQPGAAAVPTDVSAQARKRPQIRVTPRYRYRNRPAVYPLPYDYDYPGPNGRRACVARLVQEARPSGTVVVPRMHCWWVRG